MKNTIALLFLLSVCLPVISPGQPADTVVANWEQGLASVVLLKNKNSLLPLKELEVPPVYWYSFGLGAPNTFEETLAKYTPEPAYHNLFPVNSTFIIALNFTEINLQNADYQEFEKKAKYRLAHSRVIAVLFGPPEMLDSIPDFLMASALILSSSAEEAAQSIAAQIIFGGCAASGVLQTDAGRFFKKGEGLKTPDPVRLGYAPPPTVGLNGQLLEDSIRSIVEEGIRAHAYPGAQVLVAKDGKVVFHKAYGFHTYDSLQALHTTDLYDFASITKVTSTLPALMKLYGEGLFDLDAPLKRYLPFFKKSDKANISYRQFLAHNGRLKASIVFWREAKGRNGRWKRHSFRNHYSRRYPIRITDSLFLFKNYRKQIFKEIRDSKLNEKPGYVYSDLSFILYPAVVEKLTRQPLEKYLRSTFYGPLGASTLTYNPLRRFSAAQIVPTERDTFFRKIQVHGTVHDETAAMLGGVSGHAGLFGSANDLAKLVQLYLNGGKYGGRRYISEAAIREFTRCQYCEEGNRRGLGFDKPPIRHDAGQSYISRSAGPDSFGHSGYTGTFFWADPAQNLIVIFFSNRVYPYRSSQAIYELNIRPRIHQAVYDAIGG